MTTATLTAPVATGPLKMTDLKVGDTLMVPDWMPLGLTWQPTTGWTLVRVTELPEYYDDPAIGTQNCMKVQSVLSADARPFLLGDEDHLNQLYVGGYIRRPTASDL